MQLRCVLAVLATFLAIQAPVARGECAKGPYAGFMGALSSLEHGVGGTVVVDSSCQITVNAPTYDGRAPAAYWWCSASRRPADMRAGFRANPMRVVQPLDGTKDVVLDLDPKVDFSSNCRVFSMWCEQFRANFGDTAIEKAAGAAPPATSGLSLSQCKELVPGKLQLRWNMPNKTDTKLTLALVGAQLPDNSWMAFGFADPAAQASRMIGADVAVGGVLASSQPWASDYFLTSKDQCNYQGGQSRGVCPKSGLAGGNASANSVAVLSGSRTSSGLTVVTFSKALNATSRWDRPWPTGASPAYAVWAHGPLGEASTVKLPVVLYHGPDAHSPPQFLFSFGQASNCSTPLKTTAGLAGPKNSTSKNTMPVAVLSDIDSFNVTTGDNKNYPNPPAWGLSYHLNDYETPVLRLVRGTKYTFTIMAGPTHPFYITDDIIGGASNPNETVYAGGDFSHGTAMKPYMLAWTPPAAAPDMLFYQCRTHQKLGWKIQLVDKDKDKQAPSALTDGQTQPQAAGAPAKSAASSTSLHCMVRWLAVVLVAAFAMA